MAKIAFNHDINDEIAAISDDLATEISTFKYRIVEAAIEAFAALPKDLQQKLISTDAESRGVCFHLLAELAISSEPEKFAEQAKPSEVG